MFRVTYLVNDQNLAKTIKGLVGMTDEPPLVEALAGLEPAMPINSKQATVKTRRKRGSGENSLISLVKKSILSEGIDHLGYPQMRMIISRLGYSPNSANNTIHLLTHREKFLRPLGEGQYEVRH